jgi:phage baseplate assembly protein W
MKIAYDLNAIRNSIKNLFNTIPGERLLLPDYGCDLRQYIFENVTDSTAKAIGRTIQRSIKQWEPRVKVINIDVAAYVSTAQYEITLVLEVPFLQPGETFNIAGLLNKQGFTVV